MVIADYSDERQQFFNDYTSKRNKEYCHIHNYEYLELTGPFVPYREESNKGKNWLKFTFIRDMFNNGFLKDGDVISHIDADMVIVKKEIPLICNKSYTYSIDSGNTHNTGLFSLKVNDWSRNLIKNILSDERYEFYKDKIYYHPFVNNYNFWGWFREQASWYSLAGIVPHSQKPFWELSDYGWHSEKDDHTVYSLEELYENVEILPTEWNVTEMPGESNCHYNINPIKKEDVIIRHFAGGQLWRKEWF